MPLAHQGDHYLPSGETSKKIFCVYHQTEFLTNFCLQKQCLMPLCPSCVAEHTQEHFRSTQKPVYINLNEGLHDVKQQCYSFIVSLEEYSKANDALISYIHNLSVNVHEQLQHNKQEIYRKIQQIFSAFEQRLVRDVEDQYHKNSVYNMEEAETIRLYVSERIQLLYDKIGVLKGDQCLAGLIQFYDHQQQEYENQLKDVSAYIARHRDAGKVKLVLNFEALNQRLENLCESLLTLTYGPDNNQEDCKQPLMSRLKRFSCTPQKSSLPASPFIRDRSQLGPNETIRNNFRLRNN